MIRRLFSLWLLLSACGSAPASPPAGEPAGATAASGGASPMPMAGGGGGGGGGEPGGGAGGASAGGPGGGISNNGGASTAGEASTGTQTAMPAEGHGPGTIYDLSLDAKDRPVQGAHFRLYVPDGVPQLTGVIVHQHGCGRDGINVPQDLQWQALANRWGMALLGTEFSTVFPDGDHCDRWSHIENGSSDLFVNALDAYAAKTGHAELSAAPWVLWGHSGGATWVFQISKKYPQKIVSVVIKSICEADPAFSAALVDIPMLLATGPQDLGQCYPITTKIFETYRAAGAPWTYVDEPEGTHDTAQLRSLAIPYFDAVIGARLGTAGSTLKHLGDAGATLGDHTTRLATASEAFVGDKTRASWLPTPALGQAWHQFVTTRKALDCSTPATGPQGLTAKLQAGHVNLTWIPNADLESGVQSFKIYRDGTFALSVPGDAKPFQGWNYGDEPEPVAPTATAQDATPGHAYRVSLVNGAGLESPLSDEVTVVSQ